MDLFELNEAYAAQSVAVIRELRIDPEKVFGNVSLSLNFWFNYRSMLTVVQSLLVIHSVRRAPEFLLH